MGHDRSLLRRFRLHRSDEFLILHPIERVVAPPKRGRGIDEWTLPRIALNDARDERGLVEIQLADVLAKIELRRRLDAVDRMAPIDLVAVHREDFFLGVPLLNLNREQRLFNLSFGRLVVRQKQLARELLRDRAGAAHDSPVDQVLGRGDQDSRQAQTSVFEKIRVFRRENRVSKNLRNLIVGDELPMFRRKLADDGAVASENFGDRARRVVVECGDLRKIADEREDDAARDSEQRGGDEQRRETEISEEAPSERHDVSLLGPSGPLGPSDPRGPTGPSYPPPLFADRFCD